jgi:aryl-alcohol dehydrogenase-like predicted oxidoreductase
MLGTWRIDEMGSGLSDAADLVRRACDLGINAFDTGASYANGSAEAILARGLMGIRRDTYVLSLKAGLFYANGVAHVSISKTDLVRSLETSLRSLATDYVDILQFYRFDGNARFEEALEAAGQLVATGKVKYLALSDYARLGVNYVLGICDALHLPRPVANFCRLNLLDQRPLSLLGYLTKLGIASIAYSPLAEGLLASSEGSFVGRRESTRERWLEFMNPATFIALCREAKTRGVMPSAVALQWVCDQPGIMSTVIGARTVEQLEQCVAAVA